MTPMKKSEVRRRVFQIRKQYPADAVREKSDRIVKQVLAYLSGIPAHEPMEEIYLYASYGNEVDTFSLAEYCLARNIRVALPRVCEDMENMEFYYIDSLADIESGYRDIPEPGRHCAMAEPSGRKQYMILPGVGFDLRGNRAGYGKGFYDRYLMRNPDFHKIGICFEEQIFEEIESVQTDIPMDAVITEQRVLRF